MTRKTLLLAALAAALAAPPAAAQADTEGFAAVLADGTLTRFTSQSPTATSRPVPIRGLARGERVVALGQAGARTLAIGSVGRLYALDPRAGRATPVGPPFPMGLRGLRASLAAARDGRTAQVLSDVGQRLQVDTATGAVTELPALRTTDGGATNPVADVLADGRLVGVDPVARTLVTETAPGSGVVAVQPLVGNRFARIAEPFAFTVGTDGRGYLAVGAPDDVDGDGDADREGDVRQSQVLRLDLPDTRLRGYGRLLRREVVALTSIGRVPADRRVEGVSVRMPRRVSARRLLSRSYAARVRALGLRVRADEAFQATIGLRVRGQRVGFSFGNQLDPNGGSVTPSSAFPFDLGPLRGPERRRLLSAVGTRISIVVGVRDPAGNRLVVNRRFTLVR